jgi:hypothetical protein
MPAKMSESIITDLAARYGVKVRWVDAVPECYSGPMGQGCDPSRREVYFENHNAFAEIEHYLHELVHVIVQPPWPFWSIRKCPEEFILFQFERALARATFEPWAFEQVINWQHETAVHISGRFVGDLCLGDLKPYYYEPFWRAGFGYCRALGLLDKENRPTYEWPRWDRLTPIATDLRRYFKTKAQSPLPEPPAGV